eukprot:gene22253-27214_t
MFRAALSSSKRSLALVAKPRLMGTYKTSTGLVGLAVDPNGRETLSKLSDTILQSVKRIPESSQYRTDVEKWFQYIKKVTGEKTDIKEIETAIDMGQIEEVIEMAKDELELIDFYHENKMWEAVEAAKLEADAVMARMADSVYFTSPENRGVAPKA